jgi:DNA-binding MarR family transcriptional regulator
MATKPEKMSGLVRQRQLRESKNLFSRLPAVYAASRKQGQYLLRQSAGISIVEWRTLWDLTEAGPLTIRELAKIQRTDHSLVSRALPAMRNKGLVEMRQNPEDGREMLVAITT